MKTVYLFFIALALISSANAQNRLLAAVRDNKSLEPLIGATLKFPALNKVSTASLDGTAIIADIPDGRYLIEIRYLGYTTFIDSIMFPLKTDSTLTFLLEKAEAEELEAVYISSTRSSRTIATIPTRIEVIAGEELAEKANMKPGDIRMVLNESTGIQSQQTSATSANASIRIQGLDGRYTQILKDGFPIFSGAASGLGLLQIPPLDLRQVEVIKGSASTLYGGGAIAGLVNLISKRPEDEQGLSFIANGTSAGGLDLSAFYSEKFGKAGMTVFAARNSNSAYDPADIDLTAIPKFERYTFNPTFFYQFNKNTSLSLGVNTGFENRVGGDLHFISGNGDDIHSFFEQNKTERLSSQFLFTHKFNEKSALTIRNSLNHYQRHITVPDYEFDGTQVGTFTEITYSLQNNTIEWVGGLNIWTDDFYEMPRTASVLRDYYQFTAGAFIQNNFHASSWLELETGLRADYITNYGYAVLPRISALVKFNSKFNSRIGGGLGYKAPTIFTEDSERIQYQNVLPVSSERNKLERSYGVNADVNYRTAVFDQRVSFSLNHLFFYTFLNSPLLMGQSGTGQYQFTNLQGHIDTKGMETNLKIGYQDFKLFLGYTLTDTKRHSDTELIQQPLTAKHRLNNVLMYELEDRWKLGAEAYYFSKQKLEDGSYGKSYWIFGFMAEKLWEKFSLYINFENFSDTRQTRFSSIYTGNISQPVFKDIYAPLDGFVINGGLKLRL